MALRHCVHCVAASRLVFAPASRCIHLMIETICGSSIIILKNQRDSVSRCEAHLISARRAGLVLPGRLLTVFSADARKAPPASPRASARHQLTRTTFPSLLRPDRPAAPADATGSKSCYASARAGSLPPGGVLVPMP